MNIFDGIQNFLLLINNHWTEIIVVIGLAVALARRIKNYIGLSDEEKIKIAKDQIQETMLKRVTDAEVDYYEWVKAGAVKRAQVIDKIFATYPILSKVTNQDALIAWIDEMINEALKIMRDIFENNEGNISNLEDTLSESV